MFAMGIIGLAVVAALAIALAAGFFVWVFSFLAFFRILPAEVSNMLRITAGIYFAAYGAIFTFVTYQISTAIGVTSGIACTVMFAAGLALFFRDRLD